MQIEDEVIQILNESKPVDSEIANKQITDIKDFITVFKDYLIALYGSYIQGNPEMDSDKVKLGWSGIQSGTEIRYNTTQDPIVFTIVKIGNAYKCVQYSYDFNGHFISIEKDFKMPITCWEFYDLYGSMNYDLEAIRKFIDTNLT